MDGGHCPAVACSHVPTPYLTCGEPGNQMAAPRQGGDLLAALEFSGSYKFSGLHYLGKKKILEGQAERMQKGHACSTVSTSLRVSREKRF